MRQNHDENPVSVSDLSADQTTLLLVLPLPVFCSGHDRLIDRQAHNGIHRWLDNFDNIIVCMPALEIACAPADVVALREIDFGGRCKIVSLPEGRRRPISFAKSLREVQGVLDVLIDKSTHLSFAIGGLFGDWAAVAALRAHKRGRAFSVWTDRVESQVTQFHASKSRGLRKLYWSATAFAMKHYERFIIRRATLGLFHGADCYAAYCRFSRNAQLVHNIHLSESARIQPAELDKKIRRSRLPVHIVYAGRAHAEKGVCDWIETLALLAQRNVDFSATWFGDGPDLEAARGAVATAGLRAVVKFAGALYDRDLLLDFIQDADIFLFCHKTQQSPRCLIEALISGTPIVGYESMYPRDLIRHNGGGVLTKGEPQQLADAVEQLVADHSALARLTRAAAADGHPFTDTSVFRYRSDLIKSET